MYALKNKTFSKAVSFILAFCLIMTYALSTPVSAFAAASETVTVQITDSANETREIAVWTYDSANKTYIDQATNAELSLVKDFTQEENLKGTVNGQDYDFSDLGCLVYTGANQKPDCRAVAVATKGILLEDIYNYAGALLGENGADVLKSDDVTLILTGGGFKTNAYKYSEYWGETKYYYPAWYADDASQGNGGIVTEANKTDGRVVPTTLAIMGYHATTGAVIEDLKTKADDLNALRNMQGQQQDGAANSLDANMGFNSVKNISTIAFTLNKTFAEAGLAGSDVPDVPVWDGTLDFSWYDENNVKSEYHISTPAQMAALAWICSEDLAKLSDYSVNTNGNVTAINGNVPTQQNTFTGVQFYLDNDIDMGGVYDSGTDSWSGPNYYPIGSQAQNDTADGQFNGLFSGSFDGQGHVVKNIHCDRGTGQSNQAAGLFGRVGAPDGAVPYPEVNITIENVAVIGDIKCGRSVGGVVGKTLHVASGYQVTIKNCLNFASISSTDSKGTGGISGAGWNKPVIDNCANFGTVIAAYKNGGGISGSFEGTSHNCYNVGDISKSKAGNGQAFGTNSSGANVYNFYWLTGTSNTTGANAAIYNPSAVSTTYEITDKYNGTELNAAEFMKSADFVKLINGTGRAWATPAETDSIYALMDSLGFAGYPVPRVFINDTSVLEKVELEADPRLSYGEGETFDTSDMVVKAYYSDGTSEKVTDFTVSNTNALTRDDKKITVTANYSGSQYPFEFNIKVDSGYTVELTPSVQYVAKGSTFTVDLIVKAAAASTYAGMEAVVNYDNTAVKFVNATSEDINTAEAGKIKFAEIGDNKDLGSGYTALSLTFKALDTIAAGKTDAVFSVSDAMVIPQGMAEGLPAECNEAQTVVLTDYPVDLPDTVAEVKGVDANGQYVYGQDIAFKIPELPENCFVTVKIGNGSETTLNAVNDVYTIPAADVNGAVEISVKSVLGTVSFIDFDTYGAAPTNFKVVKFVPADNTGAGKYQYNGSDMFKSEKYNCYVFFAASETTDIAALQAITNIEGTNPVLAYDGDVNGNAVVKIDDAQLVYDLYTGWAEYQADSSFTKVSVMNRLEADFNGDGVVDINDARAIVAVILGTN
ncbi:MAG: cohesin domain-containing protein [Bacillota bacterium]